MNRPLPRGKEQFRGDHTTPREAASPRGVSRDQESTYCGTTFQFVSEKLEGVR